MESLATDTRAHSGPDGLSIIRRLIQQAPTSSQKDGYLLLKLIRRGRSVPKLLDPTSVEAN
jgi:hypothetical protein